MPNAAYPQSYNRYSYTYNNPILFKDSSGHCADNGAEACWSYLESQFCNDGLCESGDWRQWVIAGGNSVWTIAELMDLRQGLLYARDALAGIGINWMDTNLQNVRFERVNKDSLEEDRSVVGRYRASTNVIQLTNKGFSENNHLRTILHELGHALDDGKALTSTYGQATGSCIICFNVTDVSSGYCFRDYGCNKLSEGWADAFSLWAYTAGSGGAPEWGALDRFENMTEENRNLAISNMNNVTSQVLQFAYGLFVVPTAGPTASPTPSVVPIAAPTAHSPLFP